MIKFSCGIFSLQLRLCLSLALCLCLTPLPGLADAPFQAAPSPSLTLEQAIAAAIANNPGLKAERAKLAVSEAEITKAGVRLNPSIVTDNGVAEETYRPLGLSQTFELGGKRRKRVAVAEGQRDVVLSEINTAVIDLRAEVRRAYTQLYNAQQRQKATQEIVDTAQRLMAIAQEREAAGDIAQFDLLQPKIALLNARNELQTIAYEVVEAKNHLNTLLRQPLSVSLTLAPPPDFVRVAQTPSGQEAFQGNAGQADPELAALLDLAFRHRPEIQTRERNVEVARRQLMLARANRIPNLTVVAGPDVITEPGQQRVGVFVSGNLDIPVFDRQQGQIREAVARRAQLRLEQAALANNITLEVANAFTALINNRNRLRRYETELLPEAENLVDKSHRAFAVGKASILLPITAQQAYIDTRLGYLRTLLDYQNAISRLERALGTGL
jgi:cobalt-zinc-cadmium efflux system outer membrane protein